MDKVLLNDDGDLPLPLLSAGAPASPDIAMDDDLLQRFLSDPNMLEGLDLTEDTSFAELILSP